MKFLLCSVCDSVVPESLVDAHVCWHGADEIWCEGTNPIAHYQDDCQFCSLGKAIEFAETQPDGFWRELPWRCACGRNAVESHGGWSPVCRGEFTPRIVLQFA